MIMLGGQGISSLPLDLFIKKNLELYLSIFFFSSFFFFFFNYNFFLLFFLFFILNLKV
jgi:hypothetical protein